MKKKSIIIKDIEYIIIEELGKGGFGKVSKVLSKTDNKEYAIKEIPIKGETEEQIKILKNEANILSKFNCNNIVKYYDSSQDDNNIYILMELCEGENLKIFLDKNRENDTLIKETDIINIIKQICIGIREMHNKKIIHRDLKPENIFMKEAMNIKIGDFGTSKQLNLYKTHLLTKNKTGSSYYIAPEILINGKYNLKSDIWSLGCIIYELFTLNTYYNDKIMNDIKKIDSDIYNYKWQELIDSLLEPDYTKRLDINQVIRFLENKLQIIIDNNKEMPICCNCQSIYPQYYLCNNCYDNIFKSLYCDGHCGKKCDPSQRLGSNIITLPFWWYCDKCLKKRENANLSPQEKKDMINDEIDKLKKIIEKLDKENEKLNKVIEPFKGTYHDYSFKLENFYDIIINIDNLRHLDKGWKVKFTELGKKNYDIMKNKEVITIGVIGNRNIGKSFILSKLSNINLPNGANVKTEGISFKYLNIEEGKDVKYILLDSAGFENPLLETDEFKIEPNINRDDALKKLKLVASDKILTEYFIENFIIQKSDILIVVIGLLNYPEQKLLNRMKIEYKYKYRYKNHPPLFVIHNLKTFTLKKQVEDYIKEILIKSASFKLKEIKNIEHISTSDGQENNNIYFIEEFYKEEDKDIIIYHLILAMHGTEAGNYYNNFVYKFLENQYEAFPIHHKFPIIEDIKQQCIENSKKIMIQPIESIDEFENSESIIKLISRNDEVVKNRFSIKDHLIDDLGFSNFYGANFKPKYAYFKTIIDTKPYLCIQVEIPGEAKVSCRAEISGHMWNIIVKGNKIVSKNEIQDEKTKYITREEGEFNLLIKLNVEDYQLIEKKPDRNKSKKENGLYCYYFRLVGEEGSSSSDRDEDF